LDREIQDLSATRAEAPVEPADEFCLLKGEK